jgi:diguanylate cyclase (GGDEF)-like protein
MSAPIPHKVEFRPTPEYIGRDAVIAERRRGTIALAAAAAALFEAAAESSYYKDKAYKDEKTGLPNNRAFAEDLPRMIKVARETGVPLALMVLDVKGLKRTNDNDGHQAGDNLLKSVAPAVKNIMRDDDYVYRAGEGSDEFAVILLNYRPDDDKTYEELNLAVSERVKSDFDSAAQKAGIPYERHVGLSIGIALLVSVDSPESFFERADLAEGADKEKIYADLSQQGISFVDRRLIP